MTQAINLEAELGGTVHPNPDHACIVNGERFFEFEASYIDTKTGRAFTLSFWALDFADARRRIACMRETIAVTGQIYATYPEVE